jgi:methionine aminopeptidase
MIDDRDNRFHGDTSATFLIGQVDALGTELVQKTREALERAIAVCRPGAEFKMIGDAIKCGLLLVSCRFSIGWKNTHSSTGNASEVADGKFGISEDFCGHGIGTSFQWGDRALSLF